MGSKIKPKIDLTRYCGVPAPCEMRARFLLAIVAEDHNAPRPADLIDFLDFSHKTEDGQPLTIVRIRFCPFCGRPTAGPLRILKGSS